MESAALPAAMEQYLDQVEAAEREEEPLVSKDGVVAPAWYTKPNPYPNPNPNPNPSPNPNQVGEASERMNDKALYDTVVT